MNTVSVREARQRLSELLAGAQRGESFSITRRGREVARIVPPPPAGSIGFPDLSEFRRSIRLTGPALSATVIALRGEERV